MSASDTDTEAVTGTVLETNEDGHYRVTAPIGGMEPETVCVVDDGETYVFEGYVGKDCRSKVAPDVLLYEEVSVT